MKQLRPWLIPIILLISFTAKAQYIDLIGSTEKQILDKVSADYPTVKKDTTEVGAIPVLNFEDHQKGLTCSFYLYPKKDACYLIKRFAPIRFMNAYVKLANSRYKQVGNNLWQSNEVQIRIIQMGDKVLTTFSKPPSGKEI